MHIVLVLFVFISSITPAQAGELFKFKESSGPKFNCMADDDPKCVQGAPNSDKPCLYHDDCKIGCKASSGQALAGCFEKSEVDQRNPVSNEKGGARDVPNACIRQYGREGHCGCLPIAKRCGEMTEKYMKAFSARGSVIGFGGPAKKVKCKTNEECHKPCEDAGYGKQPGGISCGCLPDVKLCGFDRELMPN